MEGHFSNSQIFWKLIFSTSSLTSSFQTHFLSSLRNLSVKVRTQPFMRLEDFSIFSYPVFIGELQLVKLVKYHLCCMWNSKYANVYKLIIIYYSSQKCTTAYELMLRWTNVPFLFVFIDASLFLCRWLYKWFGIFFPAFALQPVKLHLSYMWNIWSFILNNLAIESYEMYRGFFLKKSW